MRTIGEIRRLRIRQLITEGGLNLADINRALERRVNDSTLSQILNAAPESRTKKPRQMGDAQARTLEKAFDKPEGWLDRDPDFEALQRRLETVLREPTAIYNIWPFKRLDAARVRALPAPAFTAVEDTLLGAVEAAERLSHLAA